MEYELADVRTVITDALDNCAISYTPAFEDDLEKFLRDLEEFLREWFKTELRGMLE